MTITTNPARNEYTANAGQTVFNYTFKIFEDTDLNVYVTPVGQDFDDSLYLTTQYTVSGVGDESGGAITLNNPANQDDLITIVSNVPSSRTIDYQNNGDFRPGTVNGDFDRVVSMVKKIEDSTNRSVLLPQSQQGPKPLSIENPESQRFLRWKSDLSGLENVLLSELSGNLVGASTIPYVFDSVEELTAPGMSKVTLEMIQTAGQVSAKTISFYDGSYYGGGDYVLIINDGSYTPNLTNVFALYGSAGGSGDPIAILQTRGGIVFVEQFGAERLKAIDSSPAINAALDTGALSVRGLGSFKISSTINFSGDVAQALELDGSLFPDFDGEIVVMNAREQKLRATINGSDMPKTYESLLNGTSIFPELTSGVPGEDAAVGDVVTASHEFLRLGGRIYKVATPTAGTINSLTESNFIYSSVTIGATVSDLEVLPVGITIGGNGANCRYADVSKAKVYNFYGTAIVWENGATVKFNQTAFDGVTGDGIVCTQNYTDNNHGKFDTMQGVNASLIGYNFPNDGIKDISFISRHHSYKNAKHFGCGRGFYINSRSNEGVIFGENGVNPNRLGANSRGNHIEVQETAAEFEQFEDVGAGNVVEGYDSFNRWTVKRSYTRELSVTANIEGQHVFSAPADRTFQNVPEGTTGVVTNTNAKGGASKRTDITEDRIEHTNANGTGRRSAWRTGSATLNFGVVGAGASAVSTIAISGIGGPGLVTASILPFEPSAGNFNGIIFSLTLANNQLRVNVYNTTAGAVDLSSVQMGYQVELHFS